MVEVKLRKIINKYFDAETYDENKTFMENGINSLEVVNMIVDIEKTFGIQLSDFFLNRILVIDFKCLVKEIGYCLEK